MTHPLCTNTEKMVCPNTNEAQAVRAIANPNRDNWSGKTRLVKSAVVATASTEDSGGNKAKKTDATHTMTTTARVGGG